MKGQTLIGRLVLVLLVAVVFACMWLWWTLLDQQAEVHRVSGELAEARVLRGELVRLRDLQETMRTDLQGLCERLIEGPGLERPPAVTTPVGDIPVSALHRLVTMLEEQNKELATGLEAAEKRVTETAARLNETQAHLNQAAVDLAKTKTELTTRATQLAGTQTKLSDHEKQVASQKGDIAKLQEQLTALVTERGKLLGEKQKLETQVKTLTTAENDHSTTIAALQHQLDQSKEEAGRLTKDLETANRELAAVKKQLDELKKKLETSSD